jgi:hypothetical protein
MPNNNNKSGGAAALGIAALAAAAAGAYYFYGSDAATAHRRKMKSWAVKARGEVMERMEKMKEVTKDGYEKAVNEVMDKYKKVKNIPPEELTGLAREMKGHWDRINKHLSPAPAAKRKPAARKKTTRNK